VLGGASSRVGHRPVSGSLAFCAWGHRPGLQFPTDAIRPHLPRGGDAARPVSPPRPL